MIQHITTLTVACATAEQFYDFMINPCSDQYHAWWPEEHSEFRITSPGADSHLGDEVFYDENVGERRRLRFYADVVAADRPTNITWQMKKMRMRIPAVLSVAFTDTPSGLIINHELRIGYKGAGRIFDPVIRLYFTASFANALEKHCLEEWPRLARYLNNEPV